MKKKDCPWCGKKKAGYSHAVKCPKKPKGAEEALVVTVGVGDVGQAEVNQPPAEDVHLHDSTELLDPEKFQVHERCGKTATRLDVYNWRCPECGDYSAVSMRK